VLSDEAIYGAYIPHCWELMISRDAMRKSASAKVALGERYSGAAHRQSRVAARTKLFD
jgi:hypothetical protein